jgi:hypothetical protein
MGQVDLETHESLRAECERLQHKLAYHEADIARVDSLKEKVTALVWENDSLRDKATSFRAQLDGYKGLAMALQQGALVWAKTPEAASFEKRSEVEKLRLVTGMAESQEQQDRAVEYHGLTPIAVPK